MAAVGAIAGPVAFVTAWAALGAGAGGYDPARDAISRLAALGAPTRPAMTAGLLALAAGMGLYGVKALRLAAENRRRIPRFFHRDEARWVYRVNLLREWDDPLGSRWQDEGYPVMAPANPLRGLATDSAYLASVLDSIELVQTAISGMLAETKRTTIATGPTTVHHPLGPAARANTHRPHQNAISPR